MGFKHVGFSATCVHPPKLNTRILNYDVRSQFEPLRRLKAPTGMKVWKTT